MNTPVAMQAPLITNNSPNVVVEKIALPAGHIFVVRDDLLPGGTKQRAIEPYLGNLRAVGYSEFVYASPFSGYAQVALAAACEKLGLRCVIFAEQDQTNPEPHRPHEFTERAIDFGARVILSSSLAISEAKAESYAQMTTHRKKIPLGFDTPEFRAHLASALQVQWGLLNQKERIFPRRIWLPLGSGTLTRVFQSFLPNGLKLNCVDVHVLSGNDPRIASLLADPRIELHSAPELFAERAGLIPPLPSNSFYDAKLWRFLQAYGREGDLWWNVA